MEPRKPDEDLLYYLEYNEEIFTAADVRTIHAEVAGHNDEDGWYWVNNHPTDSWGGRIFPTLWMPLPPAPAPPQETK